MILKQINLHDFKNYTDVELSFVAGINVFIGPNGIGKTNLLEAIYYLAYSRGYFNANDHQNIRHDQEAFAIHGTFNTQADDSLNVSCIQKRGQKKILRCNGKDYERFSEHIGRIPLVMISPADRDLINDGSDQRRKFMDMIISQFDKSYLEHLIRYNKALDQRNRLLKQRHPEKALIEIFDHQMIPTAEMIYRCRARFFEHFIPTFKKYYALISEDKEEVNILYVSSLSQDSTFEKQLQASLERDQILQYTSVGIHKDDLQFLIATHPVKRFASQGQQKSFTVALRLAQFEYVKTLKQLTPILLLDDIFDKLDHQRVRQILAMVEQAHIGQVFISDTDPDRVKVLCEHADVRFFSMNTETIESHERCEI